MVERGGEEFGIRQCRGKIDRGWKTIEDLDKSGSPGHVETGGAEVVHK